MQPLTERRPVNGPMVYGFLRVAPTAAARQAALADALAEYCRSHELVLGGLFIERESGVCPRTAAFTGLLDVLALPDAYAVVLPAASQLGPRPIAAERKRQISDSTGARLLLVRGGKTARRRAKPFRERDPHSDPVQDAET
ncbi:MULTISPECIES: hypothetical protein [Streptomyces]|uniref:Resolvase/invertase-type recombinase catalytic domain-containing protein n=1 Tax=Streptomyces rimosus subsp. rimosus TaxID=132474 RepID=A0ABY3Z543_STRRM|nr:MULTISPECIES: hypothetical protein [Streptomyces]KOG76467.1 hypothetical protein ADK78_10345 [Kitasatospora aureofaciens]KEF03559.1 hypothetical protein DF17_28395 [Streptomyces rimosus]KOT41198.1 hypothetical protein ADK84_12660 [Streptomyces sp. NRRL WC-3701]KOT46169.1 hypothetical protein ADK42_01565 [Streptomyces rimosus subsp. rimosus]KOT68253.1 hypothetical protein ADK44_01625 [Streptomyces rimosus subsp. rimosus]